MTLRAGHVDIELGACGLALDVYLTLRARGYRGGIVACGTSCAAAARPADVAG